MTKEIRWMTLMQQTERGWQAFDVAEGQWLVDESGDVAVYPTRESCLEACRVNGLSMVVKEERERNLK